MEVERISVESLRGTWRLSASRAFDELGREAPPPYGPAPVGCLILTTSGRMMGMICDSRASLPEGDQRSYTSYCGQFELNGDELTTHVDAASDLERVGSRQVRQLKIQSGLLVISPPRRANGEMHEFLYEKISSN